MVSLRRRRLLGLCSGNSSFVTPLPLYCENLNVAETSSQQAKPSEQSNLSDLTNFSNRLVKLNKQESGSSNVSDSSLSKEQSGQQSLGPPLKRRKPHSRKQVHDQEPCFMRGVYYKNMKWQAAIKVDKKQIHLGTVESQEEAARLYDRAAFMCGREPNFELPEEEKMELCKLKWEDFLVMTREAITSKKHKRKHSPEDKDVTVKLPAHSDNRQGGVSQLSACGVTEQEQQTTVSKNVRFKKEKLG